MATPTVSIVTPVYNDPRIRNCLASVREQRGAFDVEHVVVDGGSTDETTEVLDAHAADIDRLLRADDDGIYDAMNRGIDAATGDIVGILNADDRYRDDRVLERVTERLTRGDVSACYGDLVYVNDDDTVVRRWQSSAFEPGKFYLGWMPPHPTFFVRRSVYETYGTFDLEFSIAADYEFMLRILLDEAVSVGYIDSVLVEMAIGGESNGSVRNVMVALREVYRAWSKHNSLGRYTGPVLHPLSKLPQYRVRPFLFG